jgi:hypothetical protein
VGADVVIAGAVAIAAGLVAGLAYGGYRMRKLDAHPGPPPDFERPPDEGDLL